MKTWISATASSSFPQWLAALVIATQAAGTPAQTWSTPLPLVPVGNTEVIGNQDVAENSLGQIVAIWEQGTSLRARVRKGAGWGAVAVVGDPLAPTTLVDLAMATNGQAVALLRSTPVGGGNPEVRSAFLVNGGWTPTSAIPVTPGLTVLGARVRYDGAGLATLVWTESDGTNCSVRAANGNATSGWSGASAIGTGCFDLLQLAVNKRGDAVLALGATVIPRPGSRAGSPAFAAFRSRTGAWSPLVDVGSSGIGNGPYQTPPSVAIGANGAAVMLLSDANVGVKWSRKSATANSWSATTFLDGAEPAVPTAVAIDSKGNTVAVFPAYYANVGPAPLLAATLAPGSYRWSAAQSITDASSDISSFSLTTTPAGSFIAGWVDAFAIGGPPGSTATLGVSVRPSGAATWAPTMLDADYSHVSPPYDRVSVAAASGKSVALWNMETRPGSGGVGNPLLKVATTRLP